MSRARVALAACVAVVAIVVAAVPASAATSVTASQTVKFTNQAAIQLSLSNTSYDFGVVDPLAVNTSAPNATVATVFSNAAVAPFGQGQRHVQRRKRQDNPG